MSEKRGGDAERLMEVLGRYLKASGLGERVKQSEVIASWSQLVGPEIAAVTKAVSVSDEDVLFVLVRTPTWLNELSLMEPELLVSVNRVTGNRPIRRIRWGLMR